MKQRPKKHKQQWQPLWLRFQPEPLKLKVESQFKSLRPKVVNRLNPHWVEEPLQPKAQEEEELVVVVAHQEVLPDHQDLQEEVEEQEDLFYKSHLLNQRK